MNKKHFLWRLFAVAFAAVLTFGLGACSDDDTDEGDFQLYYPEVTNFGPSMSYVSGNPSYVGGTDQRAVGCHLHLEYRGFAAGHLSGERVLHRGRAGL